MYTTFSQKILSLSPHEVQRTRYAWLIRLIFKMGLTIGWTTVISLFVTRFSISALPVLFLVQALLTISGMFFYSAFMDRFEARFLVLINALLAAATLLVAAYFHENTFVFFPLVLIANGIFISQILIFLSNYVEDFFAPHECERIFPLIESAETIGGIMGGFMLSNVFISLGANQLIGLWIALIMAFLAVIYLLQPKTTQFYNFLYEMKVLPNRRKLNLQGLQKSLGELRKVPFLQVLLVIFFLQWVMAHFLEFQYTKVVDQSVGYNALSHQELLVHGLGNLHMIFNASALMMQLLLASRLMKHIGTFGGFLFHAMISFLSSASMLLGFGYFTTVLAKNNAEMSGIVNKGSYEASYYAFHHGTQRAIRELFEGFVAPLGVVAGTVLILLVQNFFVAEHASLVLNVFLVFAAGFTFFLTFQLQAHYTGLVKENLAGEHNKISRMHALEILAQKGHQDAVSILLEALKIEQDTDVLGKMLKVLMKLNKHEAVPVLISYLDHGSDQIKRAAIEALLASDFFTTAKTEKMFSREKVCQKLEHIYAQCPDEKLQEIALKAMLVLSSEPARLLAQVLHNGKSNAKIYALEFIAELRDSMAAEWVEKCLSDSDPRVRAKAVMVLYRQHLVNEKINNVIEELLDSNIDEEQIAACEFLGELHHTGVAAFLHRASASDNQVLSFASCLALLKRGDRKAGTKLANLLLIGNPLILAKAKVLTNKIPLAMKNGIANELQDKVIELSEIPNAGSYKILNLLEVLHRPLLEQLRDAYESLDLRENVDLIKAVLHHKESLRRAKTEPVTFAA